MDLQFAQLIIEGLFAIVLTSIGFYLRDIASKISDLSKIVTDLRIEMVKDFVTKAEWQQVRDRLHELGDELATILARDWVERRK